MAGPSQTTFASAWVRALLLFLGIFTLTYLYAATHFMRDPGSFFFNAERAYDRFYSKTREAQAFGFVEEVAGNGANQSSTEHPISPSMCASFVTVARPIERQYISNAIGSLLEGLTPQERADLNLKLFFAETDPRRHPSFTESWLNSTVDDIYTYSDIASDDMREQIRSYAEKAMFHEKGVLDYSMALQRCLDTSNATYIAVFEDDILVARGWLARTILALRDTESVIGRSAHPDRDWLGLRLFNQERSTGWSSLHPWGNNELLITVLIDTVFLLAALYLRRNVNRLSSQKLATFIRRYTDAPTLLVIAFLAVPAFVLLFFQSGKASLLPPSPGLKIEDFGCCSQAMIFNRREVPGFIEFLRSNLDTAPYDMLTAMYAKTKSLHRLSLYPMQAQHIGVTSATGTTKEESVKVWSMAFENLDPKWIDTSHEKAVQAIYSNT